MDVIVKYPDDCPVLRGLRRRRLVVFMAAGLSQGCRIAMAAPAPSPEPAPGPQIVEFSASFLGTDAGEVDLTRFERGNPVLPGSYRVDLYVNEFRLSREDVRFVADDPQAPARPCFTRPMLDAANVDLDKLAAEGVQLDGDCIDVSMAIPGATTQFDVATLRLDVSIPQVYMRRHARGYVDPALWDAGVTAFTLGYSFTAYATHYDGHDQRQAYLGLKSGLNLGRWRLRNLSALQWRRGDGNRFQNTATYAEHDVTRWQSQLRLGDGFTTGELFDSTGFRGVSLASDDRMRPDSMSGYAPIVRGMAETNANVQIRQNGYLIYETTVSPGAFEIDDLYATGYGGDLEVTVTEADARVRSFVVPYAAVPRLIRPGTWRYAVTAGQVRNDALVVDGPYFVEGTYQRGINNWLTGYAGVQASDDGLYRSVLAGAAFNTPVGAVSADITRASTEFGHGDGHSGYSARVTYSKSIPSLRTDFALAALRYSSQGFLGLADAVRLDDDVRSGRLAGGVAEGAGQERSRLQLTLNQRLGDRAGSLYISGSKNDYWRGLEGSSTWQVGYSNAFRSLAYGISAARTRMAGGSYDQQYYLSLSVPLGRASAHRTPQLNLSSSFDGGDTAVRAGVNGSAGERDQVNYGVSGNFGNGDRDTIGANVSWRAPRAMLGGSYTYGSDREQASVSAAGAVVAHAGGITFTRQLGETIGLVEAKGAGGASLTSDPTNRIDPHGYAVVSSLMAYRLNDVSLNPKGISYDIELDNTRLKVAPRAGAVVPLRFGTRAGHGLLLHLLRPDGKPVPFGADVLDVLGNPVGMVGQAGQAFARVEATDGTLRVRWDGGRAADCSFHYRVDAAPDGQMPRIEAICVPGEGDSAGG
jgi:outer membrane usher protein